MESIRNFVVTVGQTVMVAGAAFAWMSAFAVLGYLVTR